MKLNVIIFLIGLVSSQKVNLFGEIYIGELLCALAILLNLKKLRVPSFLRPFLFLLLIWFFTQFLSDIFNQTDLLKSVKGILVPVFVAIILIGINSIFYTRNRLLPFYLIGVFIGVWLNREISGLEYYLLNNWKWGMGISITLTFVTWVEFFCQKYQKAYLVAGAILILLISLSNSARSLGSFIFISAILALFSEKVSRTSLIVHLNKDPLGTIKVFMGFLSIIFLLDYSMSLLFSYEGFLALLPPEDAFKYRIQAQSDWGIILGGRSELLISITAFFDSPFLGHGSWAENREYVFAYLVMRDEAGALLNDLSVAEANIDSFLIPTHSYLMAALVWGGIFAGLFWLTVLATLIKGFLNSTVLSSPMLVFISINLIWNVLFSPFGADARWLSSVLLWIYLYSRHEKLINHQSWPSLKLNFKV